MTTLAKIISPLKRVIWSGHARYHFDPDRSVLLPSKKKRVIVKGSSVTKEDVMIQKIESVGDEVEEVEEA